VAVSIFVNPTQFGPKEDFTKYPRPIEKDLAMCREAGVSFVFNTSPEEMYRPGLPKIVVDLPELTTVLEGAHRPGHFNGVCQVVAKLFNIVQPDFACFGQKDFQQLRILTAMVEALDWPIEMVPCPTLRETDGLAMSSRNQYLSADERQRAVAISRGLFRARDAARAGERDAVKLVGIVTNEINTAQMQIDYVAAIDPRTLRPVPTIDQPATFAVAARVGTTRLIDNVLVSPA
jgi:pantoate--beta-alanine ligase